MRWLTFHFRWLHRWWVIVSLFRVILTKMRYYRTLRCDDELFLASDESIAPYCSTSLLIPDMFFSGKLGHDLFEIETPPIEQEIDYLLWYSEVGRISPISLSLWIFDVDDPEVPILFPFIVSIDSSLHPDEIISIRPVSSGEDSSVSCSSSELFESRRHIGNSWTHSMIRESCSSRIGGSRENVLDGFRFWCIRGADGEVHKR